MARTLLDYVQTIMDDMGSDSVNSISDTIASQRVANILRRTYLDMAPEFDLPTNEAMLTLTALADSDKPTHMSVPSNIRKVHWIKVDKRQSASDTRVRYEDVYYMEPTEFFNTVSLRNSTDTNVKTVQDPTNVKILVYTDRNPEFWTSFDGENVVFDSIDQDISSTMEQSKVVAYGEAVDSWTHTDTAIPNIPEHMEPTFLAIAEERSFAWVKQQENRVTVDNARRYRIAGRNDKRRLTDNRAKYPNFGRK